MPWVNGFQIPAQVISVSRVSSPGSIGALSSLVDSNVRLTTNEYGRPRETAVISSPGLSSSRWANTLPAKPVRCPMSTVLPWVMLAVPLIWPTANGGASQAV